MNALSTGIRLALAAAATAAGAVEPDELFLPPHGDEGCWVAFYDGKNFRPPSVRLEGRTHVESFRTLSEELIEPDGDRSLELSKGSRVTDLSRIAFHDRVKSFRVLCEE